MIMLLKADKIVALCLVIITLCNIANAVPYKDLAKNLQKQKFAQDIFSKLLVAKEARNQLLQLGQSKFALPSIDDAYNMAKQYAKDNAKEWIDQGGNALNKWVQGMSQVKKPLSKVHVLAQAMISNLGDAHHLAESNGWFGDLGDSLTNAWNQAKEMGSNLVDQGKEALGGLLDQAHGAAGDMLNGMAQKSTTGKLFKKAKKAAKKAAKKTEGAAKTMLHNLKKKKIAQEIFNKLLVAKEARNQLIQLGQSKFELPGMDDAYNMAKQYVKDNAKGWIDQGGNALNKWVQGMAQVRNPVQKVNLLSKAMISNLRDAHSLAQSSGWFGDLGDSLTGAWNKAKKFGGDLLNKGKKALGLDTEEEENPEEVEEEEENPEEVEEEEENPEEEEESPEEEEENPEEEEEEEENPEEEEEQEE